METSLIRTLVLVGVLGIVAFLSLGPSVAHAEASGHHVKVKLDSSVADSAITGRVFLLINDAPEPSPREVASMIFAAVAENPRWGTYAPIFGQDVRNWHPGTSIKLSEDLIDGYPFESLSDLPPGDYWVQAVLNVYTEFRRSDGHTIWAAMDHWDGQQFHISPGNLYSEVQKISSSDADEISIDLTLSEKIPPIKLPTDTRYTKRLKFRSELASEFWGQDMYVGATIQLPKTYYDDPERRYPVHYAQGHFQEKDRFVVPDERPVVDDGDITMESYMLRAQQQNFDDWHDENAPQIIAVTFQHPVPYYDDSYLVNSANIGPYGDVLMQELLPAIESSFRTIGEPWGRVLSGGSTGGWIAAALQLYHPKTFGGAWSFCPDPVDFRYFMQIDLYEDDNAFLVPGQKWVETEQIQSRSVEGEPMNTVRRVAQLNQALGSKGRSAEVNDMWSAIYGPVGDDGYPVLIWDNETGVINREVAHYWRDNGFDLRHYAEENWSEIGPDLVGKLHFACGDMDQFYLNLAMYEMEEFLEERSDPAYGGTFKFYRPKVGHSLAGYDSMTELHVDMLKHIENNGPQ